MIAIADTNQNTNNTTDTTTTQDTTVDTVKKFVLKFENLDTTRPGVICDAENFASVLHSGHYSVEQAKTMLISHFISAQNEKTNEIGNTSQETIWSYNVNTKSNTTTIYAVPKINFLPIEGDLETMQGALTQAKISASFFDGQISKQLDTVGIKTTRANIRAYRKSYISQISKLLLEEILTKKPTAYVTRWFDRINGNSYFSVSLSSEQFAINVPMAYGYDNAENLVIRALRLECPRTMRARDVLERNGVTVVDLGYCTKGELYKAAFHI
ncbi:MAG: hypothetical protein ACMV0I_09340 [Pseudomonas sp.]